MLKNMKKIEKTRNLFVLLVVIIATFCLSKINVFNNHFVLVVPWLFFCFLNDKRLGIAASFVAFFVIGSYNPWYYILMTFVIVSIVVFKCFSKIYNKRIEFILGIYNFVIVFITSILSLIINRDNGYLGSFFFAVGSYWMERLFYELYLVINSKGDNYLNPRLVVFSFVIISVCTIAFGKIPALIAITFIMFLVCKIGVDVGTLYAAIMLGIFSSYYGFDVSYLLFLAGVILIVFLGKVSKATLFFMYLGAVGGGIYYLAFSHDIGICCLIGCLLYCFIDKKWENKLSEKCYGNEKYIEKLKKENKEVLLKMGKKILKMESVFSLVNLKISEKGRIKKYERELIAEEINVFDQLLKTFAIEIKNSVNDFKYKVLEEQIYQYGIDLLSFDVKENVFDGIVFKMNVRGEKEIIINIITRLVSVHMKRNFAIVDLKYNDIFDFYEIVLKKGEEFVFEYGVDQKSKSTICGDSYIVYDNEEMKVFAISDGMGFGEEAKRRSKTALDLLKKFLDVGFDMKQTINSINCVLKKEYMKDSYATLDIFIFDKFKKEFYFYKNGASNSFVFINDYYNVIEGNDLPLGIIDKIDCKVNKIDLEKNGIIVMISDGVDEESILKLDIKKETNPQKIAKKVLNDIDGIKDDKSIIVVKIKKLEYYNI